MKGRFPIGKVSYRITVNLEIQPEGCYMVTCEELPELLTQGDTIEEALHHTLDAFMATIELYEVLEKRYQVISFIRMGLPILQKCLSLH